MTNLEMQNNIYTFSINGGDLKTTKVALYGPILCIIVPPFLYWYRIYPYLFPDILPLYLDTWLFLLCLILGFTGAFLLLQRLNEGDFTRFHVVINRNTEKISAYDRQKDQRLWEEDFHPKYLYITTINVIISDEEFSFPTLVYAEEHYPQVEESVPYPELSVLGFGEAEDINKILTQLQNDG